VPGSFLGYNTKMKLSFDMPKENNENALKLDIKIFLTNAFYYYGYLSRSDLNTYLGIEEYR
jgi:hypothetical protein